MWSTNVNDDGDSIVNKENPTLDDIMKFLKGESFIQGVKQDVNSIIILLNNFTERFIAVEDDLKAVKKDTEDNRQDISKLQQDYQNCIGLINKNFHQEIGSQTFFWWLRTS